MDHDYDEGYSDEDEYEVSSQSDYMGGASHISQPSSSEEYVPHKAKKAESQHPVLAVHIPKGKRGQRKKGGISSMLKR